MQTDTLDNLGKIKDIYDIIGMASEDNLIKDKTTYKPTNNWHPVSGRG